MAQRGPTLLQSTGESPHEATCPIHRKNRGRSRRAARARESFKQYTTTDPSECQRSAKTAYWCCFEIDFVGSQRFFPRIRRAVRMGKRLLPFVHFVVEWHLSLISFDILLQLLLVVWIFLLILHASLLQGVPM